MPPARRPSNVKLTGRLKDLADIRKKPQLLLGDIQTHLLKKFDEPTDRRTDCLHPSEMSHHDWCPRRSFYVISGTPAGKTDDKFAFVRENIFAEGHDIHSRWQRWLAEMGLLWGRWHCRACDGVHVGIAADFTHLTESCGTDGDLEYKEVPLEWGIVAGHADGAVPTKDALIEIKSIGLGTLRFEDPKLLRRYELLAEGKKVIDLEGLWKDLRAPLPSHLRQANLYLWLARRNGYRFNKMIFIYEFKSNQQVREFVVTPSERIVAPILAKAEQVSQALERSKAEGCAVPPPRPRDVSPDSGICKGCPFNAVCWAAPTQVVADAA